MMSGTTEEKDARNSKKEDEDKSVVGVKRKKAPTMTRTSHDQERNPAEKLQACDITEEDDEKKEVEERRENKSEHKRLPRIKVNHSQKSYDLRCESREKCLSYDNESLWNR